MTFDQVVQEVKDEMKRQGREDEFVGAKVNSNWSRLKIPVLDDVIQIIYTVVRIVTPNELDWYTEDCLALKQEFPHLVAGMSMFILQSSSHRAARFRHRWG
jgi:adenosine deaminase CECR1